MKRRRIQWVVVGHWKPDPAVWVQQVYGPFATKRAAQAWKAMADRSWRWGIFPLLQYEEKS